MSRQVAFFDIAGTLVRGDPWDDLLRHPSIDHSRVRRAYLRFIPFWLGRKARLIDDVLFRHRWIGEMARVLQGWSQTQTQALFDQVVNQQMTGASQDVVVARLRQHRQNGDRVVLVSGLFDGLVQAFARALDADAAIGSVLAFQDGVCLGRINGPTCAGPRKLDMIQSYLNVHGLSVNLSECYGYADSLSDAPLLEAVGHPVATYPDSPLREIAQQRGWTILPAS